MTRLKLIYHSDLTTIEVNKKSRYLQTTWLQHPPSREAFQSETRLSANYILAYQADKVLFDVRKRLYLDNADQLADQNWLEQEIAPLFQDKGQLRFAYLVTPDSYQTMYANQVHGLILERSEFFKHVEVGVFLDVKEAQDWLLNY
ncbi:hypothetical protein AAE02nite_49820 [Adhaeribacter aerolatus]|uniref:STAS/SEC14 domain-containing protein n=1 Tax=Adhaeribacter aerolatus TaxID=670289 RepID=A0A512B5T5_9BACT|nr:hypothetical protein [Adhaeribacter aerolatus]GEO07318.1 hypothetical protein AAE02nite_49820 [Adhaeribacter aerolatus]